MANSSTAYRQLIGGEWVPGGDGTYEIINPATEQVVTEAPEASAGDVAAAAAAVCLPLPCLLLQTGAASTQVSGLQRIERER
jgi:hypothetical protein